MAREAASDVLARRPTAGECLPADGYGGTIVGRAWIPGDPPGPGVVAVGEDGLYDLTAEAPTMSALLDAEDPVGLVRNAAGGRPVGALDAVLANSAAGHQDPARPFLLAPCDLQAIKACGVTFAVSLLERVIEEQARGDASRAEDIRASINDVIGTDLARVKPGSDAAMRLKQALIEKGAWSQYLEVGIGPDAEVFTKAQPLSAVGTGADIGLHPDSTWNNSEPEVVLAVNSRGETRGAALGNDLNLRDFEGRSALLLGKAKDNNASAAIGPFIRLFDESFTMDHVRRAQLTMTVDGPGGYRLTGYSSMAEISRDPEELVAATIGPSHQYPDGLMLYLGTLFAPTEDRDEAGQGFTHRIGDIVSIDAPELGMLVNRVGRSDRVAPWTFGAGALMRNLAARGLI